jgi:hypothetical protein
MCATSSSSYQHKHVSMDDNVEQNGENLTNRPHPNRRCFLFLGIVAFLIVVILACAIGILYIKHVQEDSQPNLMTRGEGEDDDFFKNTDDDSIFDHGHPEIENDKILSLENDGTKNLEMLSKSTHKYGNVSTGCETTVLLMRHCEKTGDDSLDDAGDGHCDYLGYERANWIPSLFGPEARWPAPSYLYALSPKRGRHMTFREVETLRPLAEKFGLPIQEEYATNNGVVKDLFKVISKGQACSKLIVVNWRHHMIPNLAKKLGCIFCQEEYPEDSFDQVWQIKFVWDVPNTAVHHQTINDMQQSSTSQPPPPPPRGKLRRGLKKKTFSGTKSTKAHTKKNEPSGHPLWSVYSYVTYQYFDPLQFSGMVGDYRYIPNETSIGPAARWLRKLDEGEM